MYVSYRVIDEQGYIVDEQIFEKGAEPYLVPDNWIKELAPNFNRPKWDGEKWVEGLTQEEIDAIKVNATREPSLEERLKALEQLELERMLGGV